MNRENQDRVVLIDQMLEAGGEQEAGEKYAEGWLRENPDDARIVAAGESLTKAGASMQGPERRASRLSVPVFVVTPTSLRGKQSKTTASTLRDVER